MCNLWSLKKFTCANLFQIALENPRDYVLIIYMKKYEIVYHNYAEAKRAKSAKIIYSGKPCRLLSVFGQNKRARSKQ